MAIFYEKEGFSILGELLRQGFGAKALLAQRILAKEEKAAQGDVGVAIASSSVSLACSAGILALSGFTVPLFVSVGALGCSIWQAWNSRVSQAEREKELSFLRDHGVTIERLVKQHIQSGSDPGRLADVYELCLDCYETTRNPLAALGGDLTHQAEHVISSDTKLKAIPVELGETFPTPADDIETPSCTGFDRTEQSGLEILDALVRTRRSTLLIGDTGAGKSVTQAYVITKLFECHPNAQVFALAQKADSFCGLSEKGWVTLFDTEHPDSALILIADIWKIYDKRRRLPESKRSSLSPVRLILADWLSINQSLEELKSDESVKASRYLSKLADIIYNGRELNVCLLVDLQSYNLAAVGLKADRNSRKNFNLIGLGNYSVDELGMANESYGVLVNLIGDRYIVAEESERTSLNTTFKRLQPISKDSRRPIIFSGLSPARLALLPDLRQYKSSKIAATTPEPAERSTDIPERSEIPLNTPEPDEVEHLNGLLNKTFSNSEPTDTNNPEPLNLDPFSSEITPTERGSVVSLRRSGRSKEEVIFMVWGAKKGGNKAYLAAKEKLDRILSESGL